PPRPAAAGDASAAAPADAGGQAAANVLTPRQRADALEAEHNSAQKRLLGAQAAEAAAMKWFGPGRDEQLRQARAERRAAEEARGGKGWKPGRRPADDSLRGRLDAARVAAAAAEAPPPVTKPNGPAVFWRKELAGKTREQMVAYLTDKKVSADVAAK